MSAGFHVVLDDLTDAAATFGREASVFARILPAQGPPVVDGGDTAVDASLGVVLETLGALHLAIAGAVDEHGRKLGIVRDNYRAAEVSNRELYDDMIDPDAIR